MNKIVRYVYSSILSLSLVILGFSMGNAQSPCSSGYLFWKSGSPAANVKVELVTGGATQDSSYTNPNGYYVFSEVEDEPSRCTVRVLFEDNILASKTLTNVSSVSVTDTITVPFPTN